MLELSAWILLASLCAGLAQEFPPPRVLDGPGFSSHAVNFPRRTTLIDILRNLRATTLVQLLQDKGLAQGLETSGPYTILAPTDDAFDRLPLKVRKQLHDDEDLLRQLLLYHIIRGRVMLRDFKNELRLPTLQDNKTVTVRLYADRHPTVNQVRITVSDAIAFNGVIHILSDVIFPIPSGDVMDVLESCASFDMFQKLVKKAKLEEQFRSPETPVTVFAPTDVAFQLLPEFLKPTFSLNKENTTELARALLNHVIHGSLYSTSVRDGMIISGEEMDLEIGIRNNKLREVNIARVSKADIPASNGVVHAIDRVLYSSDTCFSF